MKEFHGHRGFRGHYPENSLIGIEAALALPITGIEIDIIANKFNELIVSHEPWMNTKYCIGPDGNEISPQQQFDFNLYEMNYEKVKSFPIGVKPDENFPDQKESPSYKPLFKEVIDLMNKHPEVTFNIEIKSSPTWVNKFQPNYEHYVYLIAEEIKAIEHSNFIIQSFDSYLINLLKKKTSQEFSYGLLIENSDSIAENLSRLDFTPEYYNVEYSLINTPLIELLHRKGIKVLAWTVNDKKVASELIKKGVDGIITDYPNIINSKLTA